MKKLSSTVMYTEKIIILALILIQVEKINKAYVKSSGYHISVIDNYIKATKIT